MAATVNIEAYSDADLTQVFVYKAGGVAVDLTSNTLRMGIRRNAAGLFEDLLLTTENGGLTITDAVNGVFTLTIVDDQLLLLSGTYQHSLVRITPAGLRLLIWTGQIVVNVGPSRGPMPSIVLPPLPPAIGRGSAIGISYANSPSLAQAVSRGAASGSGAAYATGSTSTSTGLRVSNGQILDSSNNPWRGTGIAINENIISSTWAGNGAGLWAKVKSYFPKTT